MAMNRDLIGRTYDAAEYKLTEEACVAYAKATNETCARFLDPGWVGHETAGRFLDELLVELSEVGRASFDPVEAADAMAAMVREAGPEILDEGQVEMLAGAFGSLAAHAGDADPALGPFFYRALLADEGLVGRPWYRNRLWAPGLETGYASEMLPSLRAAALVGDEALARELQSLYDAVNALRELVLALPAAND